VFLTTADYTEHNRALNQNELLSIVATLDSCTNRFGSFTSQRGAKKIRALLFAVIEKPGISTWSRAKHILISTNSNHLRRTLLHAVQDFGGFDPGIAAHPTRKQLLDSMKAATADSA
jgi:hypothetical protein